jgi:siroheme decarboxylase
MQENLPLVAQPYKLIAQELGIKEEELLEKIKEFCDNGIIRRFGATLNHRNIGFIANAMVVWIVPERRIKEVSDIMIQFPQVSHCYQRPTFENWPYNIFTMVHGESKEKCEKVINEIITRTNIDKYTILYSTKELKKSSMRYLLE